MIAVYVVSVHVPVSQRCCGGRDKQTELCKHQKGLCQTLNPPPHTLTAYVCTIPLSPPTFPSLLFLVMWPILLLLSVPEVTHSSHSQPLTLLSKAKLLPLCRT